MEAPHEHTPKNNVTSNEYRTAGNKFYKEGNFFDALYCFNKSICYAEPHTAILAMTYGNRSALYFSVELYDLCLENIELARACRDNPLDNIGIMKLREDKIKKLREEQEGSSSGTSPNLDVDPFSFFTLSYPPHPNNPYIASCLEIHVNEKYGRHIVTNRDLLPGDIVVLEETPFKGLEKIGCYLRCANCFKSNKMSLIPMENCASAMFCSQKCLEYGRDKYMCAAADENFHIFPRFLLQVLDAVGGDMKKVKQVIEDPELSRKHILEYDISNPDDPNTFLNQVFAISSLVKNDMGDQLQHIIVDHPILNRFESAEDKEIAKAFMTHFASVVNNGLGYEWWEMKVDHEKINPRSYTHRTTMCIGNGIFPFSSFLSHACAFNCERLAVDNKYVIFVRIPIKKGEQLFITYGPNFDVEDKRARRARLTQKFNFICTCEACEKNWSEFNKWPKLELDTGFKDKGHEFTTYKEAKKEIIENCQYLKANFYRYPYYEYLKLLERNFMLLCLLGRLEPCLF